MSALRRKLASALAGAALLVDRATGGRAAGPSGSVGSENEAGGRDFQGRDGSVTGVHPRFEVRPPGPIPTREDARAATTAGTEIVTTVVTKGPQSPAPVARPPGAPDTGFLDSRTVRMASVPAEARAFGRAGRMLFGDGATPAQAIRQPVSAQRLARDLERSNAVVDVLLPYKHVGSHGCGKVAFHYAGAISPYVAFLLRSEKVRLNDGRSPEPGEVITCGHCRRAISRAGELEAIECIGA